MAGLADFLGTPSEWTFEGVTYSVRPPEQDEQGLFSRYLEKRYREYVERSTDIPDERQKALHVAGAIAAAAGTFDWGSAAYVEALAQPVTLAHMLYLILKRANPEKKVTEELTLEMVIQKLADIARALEAENLADPKATAAAVSGAVGLPPNFVASSAGSTSDSEIPPSTDPGMNSGG